MNHIRENICILPGQICFDYIRLKLLLSISQLPLFVGRPVTISLLGPSLVRDDAFTHIPYSFSGSRFWIMYCVLADAKTETELSVPIKEMKCIIQSFLIHKVLFFFYKMPKIKDFIYMLQMFNYVERLLFYLGYNML